MDTSKVITTNQKNIGSPLSFEEEVGLSSYDLALISINKITARRKSLIYDSSMSTYLI